MGILELQVFSNLVSKLEVTTWKSVHFSCFLSITLYLHKKRPFEKQKSSRSTQNVMCKGSAGRYISCVQRKRAISLKSLVIGGRSFASTVMAQYDKLCRRLTLYKHYKKLVNTQRIMRANNCWSYPWDITKIVFLSNN